MLRVENPPYDYTKRHSKLFDFERCRLGFETPFHRVVYFTKPEHLRSGRQKIYCTMELADADTCTLNYFNGMNRRVGVLK